MKQGEILDYTQQSKKGKLQIISFIRKQYNGADFRDIYTGLHKAILKDGKLTGVSTNLNMVYDQFNQLKTASISEFEARPKKKESKLASMVCNHELENGIKYDVVKKEYVKI